LRIPRFSEGQGLNQLHPIAHCDEFSRLRHALLTIVGQYADPNVGKYADPKVITDIRDRPSLALAGSAR